MQTFNFHISIFGFTIFFGFSSTEKVLKRYGFGDGKGYVKNTEILSSGTGKGTGSSPKRVRKYGRSTDCFKLQGVRKMYGLKLANFLVRVRRRVRITFSF